jgi:hypothetical protein
MQRAVLHVVISVGGGSLRDRKIGTRGEQPTSDDRYEEAGCSLCYLAHARNWLFFFVSSTTRSNGASRARGGARQAVRLFILSTHQAGGTKHQLTLHQVGHSRLGWGMYRYRRIEMSFYAPIS